MARARLLDGDKKAALDAIETLEDRHRGSEALHRVRIEGARALHELGRTDEGLAMLARNTKAGTKVRRDLRAETLRARVDLQLESNPERAEYLTRRLLISHPAEKAAHLDDGDRFDRADRLQSDMYYKPARKEFRRLMDHPRYGEEATWRVATISSLWYRDDPSGAREIYQQIAEEGGKYRRKTPWRIVHTYLREHNWEKALEGLGSFRRRGVGMYYRAWIPYETRDCERAIPLLRELDRKDPDTVHKGFIAWCYTRDGEWQKSIDAFQKLVKYGNPLVRGKAYYWQAYALKQLGKDEEARARLDALHAKYPLTWYDVLGYQLEARWDGEDPRASRVLAHLFETDDAGTAEKHMPGPEAWDWPRFSKSYARRLAEVRRLVEVDELERARAAYARIRTAAERAVPRDKRDQWMHFVGARTGNHYHAWKKACGSVRARSDEMPDGDDPEWVLAYPRAYRALVENLAAQYGVPSYLVYAIMFQESRFRWYQISSWDALGALQMIPKTAHKVAADLGLEYDKNTFLEPRVGFQYSVYYMAKHFEMWKSLSLTAGSYNGGPHKIERYLRRDEGARLDFLVEEFSFDQTRHYTRKVSEHMLRYIYLYETDPERRDELLDLLFPVDVNYDIPDDTGY